MTFLKHVLAWIRAEPAVVAYAVNAGVALLAAYGLTLTKTQTAAVTTIVTAVLAITAMLMTRPMPVSGLTAAAATIATATTAFGSHLTASQIGTGGAVLSVLLSLLLRQNVSPTPNAIALAGQHQIYQPAQLNQPPPAPAAVGGD